jgi:hypothetical protein
LTRLGLKGLLVTNTLYFVRYSSNCGHKNWANRTKPGPSFQLLMLVSVYLVRQFGNCKELNVKLETWPKQLLRFSPVSFYTNQHYHKLYLLLEPFQDSSTALGICETSYELLTLNLVAGVPCNERDHDVLGIPFAVYFNFDRKMIVRNFLNTHPEFSFHGNDKNLDIRGQYNKTFYSLYYEFS